jgi:hypothetical protein
MKPLAEVHKQNMQQTELGNMSWLILYIKGVKTVYL